MIDMNSIKKWFTLIEIVIVIVIIWIILLITLSLWRDYVNTMSVKTDKQTFISAYNETMAIARTSNYFDWVEYSDITLTLWTTWLTSVTNNWNDIAEHTLEKSTLSIDWWWASITIEPYSIWCTISVGTWVDFTLISTINVDEYCYSISESTCKLIQVACD